MKTIVSQFAGMGPMGWAVCGFILAGGCATPPASKHAPRHAVLKAVYTAEAITIGGSLQEAVWSTAPAYALGRAYEDIAQGKELAEAGAVQLVWNDTHLYVAVRFDDSDIIAQGKEDELHHYGLGDVAELFLKPEEQTWYWELYATPAGKKSTLWFPGRGHLGLPSAIQYESGLEVAAENEGTVNHWEDRDSAWTAEMAVPIADLTARGEAFAPGSKWRILMARYNYSRYLPRYELSMCPPLPRADYHFHEEYGILELVR